MRASRWAVIGVTSDGLATTVLPDRERGGHLPGQQVQRQVPGRDAAHDAQRLAQRVVERVRRPSAWHSLENCVAASAKNSKFRTARGNVDLGARPRAACPSPRTRRGRARGGLPQPVRHLAEQAAPDRGRGGAPGREGAPGGLDRLGHVRGVGVGEGAQRIAGGGLPVGEGGPGTCRNLATADDVEDAVHETSASPSMRHPGRRRGPGDERRNVRWTSSAWRATWTTRGGTAGKWSG